MPKIASDLSGIHEVSTLHSMGKRSIPPTPKSAFLELYLRQNEKERLIKQQHRLKRQEVQFQRKLNATNRTMAGLFKTATAVMKGQDSIEQEKVLDKATVLEYPK